MLDTFMIENFRLFAHIEVPRLGRVNLLVGKNNSGKSAFLEALAVYTSNASISMLRDLMTDRDETWNERAQPDTLLSADNAVRHLFRGHQIPDIGLPGIVLGPITDAAHQLRLLTGAYKTVNDDDGSIRRRMLTVAEVTGEDGEDDYDLALTRIIHEHWQASLLMDQMRHLCGVQACGAFDWAA